MQLRLTCSATFSKSPLNFTMYFRPLVKRPQRISTEKMFFFKNGMVGSSSQVKWCLQTKYQLLTRNLKNCDGHPTSTFKRKGHQALALALLASKKCKSKSKRSKTAPTDLNRKNVFFFKNGMVSSSSYILLGKMASINKISASNSKFENLR